MNNAEVLIKFKGDTKDVDNSVKNVTNSFGKLTSAITLGNVAAKGISKAFDVIRSNLDGAVSRFDTLNNFPKVMSNLGISAKEADESIKLMSDKLAGLPTTLDQGALAVQRFTSKNSDVKKSTNMFLALNNALLAGGASADIQATALEQLSQSYAKGKPDMMEWRSIQTAMPAQLKQISKAMLGNTSALDQYLKKAKEYQQKNPMSSTATELIQQLEAVKKGTGDMTTALGTSLRTGVISMDEFMDTIMQLNEKGVDGFQNFEKQARNSTAGLRTAIVVAKTQVVKGITSMLEGLNKGLKKAKLGSIADIIANIGKKAKEVLDGVAKWLSKIPFDKVIDALGKVAKAFLVVVAAMTTYRAVTKAIAAINLVKNILSATSALLGLTSATNLSAGAMKIFNLVMSANPIGLAVTAVVALTTALVVFGGKQSEVQKSVAKTNETLKQYSDEMKQIQKSKDEALSKSMNEIAYYQSLYNELKTITDENGRVQSGYEDRASFITGKLSEALGIEITMQDGIIQKYQEIQKAIQNTIEQKKAMAYYNAHEEEYNEALKQEQKLHNAVTEATEDRDKAEKELLDNFKKTGQYQNSTKKQREDMIEYLKGEIKYSKLSLQEKAMMAAADVGHIRALKNTYQESAKALEKSNKKYEEGQQIIDKYRRADAEMAQGHWQNVEKIFNDNVLFNGKIEKENNKKYAKEKAGLEQQKQWLLAHRQEYSDEYFAQRMYEIDKDLQLLEADKKQANQKIKEKNADILNTTKTGINEQLTWLGANQFRFEDVGKGNVQLYVDGFAKGEPMSVSEANTLTTMVINAMKNGQIDAYTAGQYLMTGLKNGMNDKKADPIGMAMRIAGDITNALNSVFGIASPSKVTQQIGKYLDEGLNIGIEKNMNKSIDVAGNYAKSITKQLSNGLIGSTNISPQLAATSSLHYSPNVIVNNQMNMRTDPLGQVVGNIKTFANGSKNDYNYGMGS